MVSVDKNILIAKAGCVLAVASLCLIAGCAAEPPKTARPEAPTARRNAPTTRPAAPVARTAAPTTRRKRSRRRDVALKIGQTAPDFELYTLDHALGKQRKASGKVRLSSFRGKRPVYLIFASYT